MNTAMRLFRFGICACLLTAFLGCTMDQTPARMGSSPIVPAGNVVYVPQPPPGQTLNTVYQILREELQSPFLGSKSFIMDPAYPNTWIVIEGCTPYNDRMTMATRFIVNQQKVVPAVHYYQLYRPTLAVENNPDEVNLYQIRYRIRLGNSYRLGFESLPPAQRVADALVFIQQLLQKIEMQREEKLARFESKAAQYRGLKVKPSVSEDLRRLAVQADVASQQRRYNEAINEYLKVIQSDDTSYPLAYFNLALLLALEKKPLSAIFYMKHYLMLAPDAPDARKAQDKIYEWEFMLK